MGDSIVRPHRGTLPCQDAGRPSTPQRRVALAPLLLVVTMALGGCLGVTSDTADRIGVLAPHAADAMYSIAPGVSAGKGDHAHVVLDGPVETPDASGVVRDAFRLRIYWSDGVNEIPVPHTYLIDGDGAIVRYTYDAGGQAQDEWPTEPTFPDVPLELPALAEAGIRIHAQGDDAKITEQGGQVNVTVGRDWYVYDDGPLPIRIGSDRGVLWRQIEHTPGVAMDPVPVVPWSETEARGKSGHREPLLLGHSPAQVEAVIEKHLGGDVLCVLKVDLARSTTEPDVVTGTVRFLDEDTLLHDYQVRLDGDAGEITFANDHGYPGGCGQALWGDDPLAKPDWDLIDDMEAYGLEARVLETGIAVGGPPEVQVLHSASSDSLGVWMRWDPHTGDVSQVWGDQSTQRALLPAA